MQFPPRISFFLLYWIGLQTERRQHNEIIIIKKMYKKYKTEQPKELKKAFDSDVCIIKYWSNCLYIYFCCCYVCENDYNDPEYKNNIPIQVQAITVGINIEEKKMVYKKSYSVEQ